MLASNRCFLPGDAPRSRLSILPAIGRVRLNGSRHQHWQKRSAHLHRPERLPGISLRSIDRGCGVGHIVEPSRSKPDQLGRRELDAEFVEQRRWVDRSKFYIVRISERGPAVGTPASNDGGTTWQVPVTTGGAEGTLTVNLANDAGLSSSISDSLPYAGQSYVLDSTGPTITIDPPSVAITPGGPVSFLVTYNDANFDPSSVTLLAAQVLVNKPLSVHIGSILVFGNGNTRTVKISGLRGDGALSIAIPAATAADLAGNPSQASAPSSNVIVDNTPASVASSNACHDGMARSHLPRPTRMQTSI